MARENERELILRAKRARSPRCTWSTRPLGKLAVRDDLTPPDIPQREREVSLKRRTPFEVDRHIFVAHLGPRELRSEPSAQIWHKVGTRP
jgi:hypothetical protein